MAQDFARDPPTADTPRASGPLRVELRQVTQLAMLSTPAALYLPQQAVQVWAFDDAALLLASTALDGTLCAAERAHAARYRHSRDRARSAGRRAALRCLLGRYLDCDSRALSFSLSAAGQPLLNPLAAVASHHPARTARLNANAAPGVRPAIAFSVSQTQGMALLAFGWNCRLGVDIEHLRPAPDGDAIGASFYAPEECAVLRAAGAQHSALFFRFWTRKEALLKAIGTGLSGEPRAYSSVGASQTGAPSGGAARGDAAGNWQPSYRGAPMARWQCCDLALAPSWCGALARCDEPARIPTGALATA